MSNRNDNMLEVQKEVIKHRIIKNGKYAILNIGSVKKTIKEDLGISLEVKLHNDYPSHAGIHGYTVDDHLISHKLSDTVKPDDMYDILVCSN